MRHARMLRVLVEKLLKNRRRFELVGIGEVALAAPPLPRPTGLVS